MTEMATETPVVESTPAGPQTSNTIAASVVEAAEADPGDETPADAEGTPVATPAEAAPATPEPELSPAAKFLLKEGHRQKFDGVRETRLPFKVVEKMLDRYVEDHKTTWQTEKQTLDTETGSLRDALLDVRRAITADPQAFLRDLAEHVDPRYKAFLPNGQPGAAAVVDDRPKPDIDLGNGTMTYSPEGVEKLLAWQVKQALDSRLQPLEDSRKAEQAERERAQAASAVQERLQADLQQAASWPLFGPLAADGSLTPFQTDVLEELRKESAAAAQAGRRPVMTLRQAYLEVQARHQEPDKIRERVIQEMKTAPKGTALTPGSPDGRALNRPKSTADIVRATLSSLENA